jgi:hypothetical protein
MRTKLTLGLAAVGCATIVVSTLAQQPYTPREAASRDRDRQEATQSSDARVGTSDDEVSTRRQQTQPSLAPVPPRAEYGPDAHNGSLMVDWDRHGDVSFNAPMHWSNEEGKLSRTADDLARKLGEAQSDADRAKLKDDLTKVLEKQFDLRQKHHRDEVDALQAKLARLKQLVDTRQERRREIITKRLDQITSAAQGLGW